MRFACGWCICDPEIRIMNIGQAAQASGVSQRMIRHYEKIGLIPAALRRDSGYRDYADADVHRLRFIANARDLGFPIGEIGTLLDLWHDRARSSAEVKALATSRAEELRQKAEAIEAMRRALLDLAGRCHGDMRPDCPILDSLSGDAN
jgi:Cu(I)-responsive transcriptional regulator